MRCIFCKKNSQSSVSVEHIVPESLGNKKLTLPVGSVCDFCNNYFATHLEKKVLESGEFLYLRFNQAIKNKKGKIPEADIIFGDQVVKTRRTKNLELTFNTEDFSRIKECLTNSSQGQMMIPVSGKPPAQSIISRWLAKMALEMLAYKWLGISDWNDYITDHKELDTIRKFARAPKPGEIWSYSKRRIYDEDNAVSKLENSKVQMIYECDILVTGTIEKSEFYFVVAFFGMEYAINIGGNSMDGYYEWLKQHDNISPLCC